MANSINTNIAAFYAQANIATAANNAQSSVARLSSGNRIVQASDDVAALATGTSLQAQVGALKTAQTNAAQGISLLQVADGGLAQIGNILQQQQSLALQAGSGALTNTTRGFLNQQFQALTQQINILATGTSFNGVQLIDGSIATGGSSSSNPIQNVALVGATSTIAPSGFTNLTATADQSKAGTTYFTGAFGATSATGFTNGTTITQPAGTYDKSLYGDLGTAGSVSVTALGGSVTTITGYTVNYTAADGTVYSGTLAAAGNDSKVAAGATLTLTATTNPAQHATLAFTVGATGFATSQDNSLLIAERLDFNLTGATYTSGTFGASPTITQATGGNADVFLRGDLSQGTFKVELAVNSSTVTTSNSAAKGYLITYTLNGKDYKGFLSGNGTAGNIGIAAAASVTLSTGDNAANATIGLTVNTQFGADLTASVSQVEQIKSALIANFQGATALNATKAGAVSGETAQAGIGLVSFTSAPQKNDITFVGDLSKGDFSVSGSAVGGYSISYTLNGSTYQGALSAYQVANGGTMVLDNGTGQLAFSITAGSANTLTATALQTALTTQFSAATAAATRLSSSTLQSNGLGGTIAGSAITSASTAGTLLDGFNGARVRLTTSQFGANATNLPPISNFSVTGTGTAAVFSVLIGDTTFSSVGTVVDNGNVLTSTFDGAAAGVLNFYKNGDKITNPNEVLRLDLSAISGAAAFSTASEASAFVGALNQVFGGGGSTSAGGLNFQLGATSISNVAVTIGSAKTVTLFAGQSLDISTQNGANAASTVVATAISTVTSLRAGVGALQSQFNFAAAALQTSVQNQDASRGQFLDTDIAAESTSYATSQVKLQAGISVLAQANQSLQALLKLIQ